MLLSHYPLQKERRRKFNEEKADRLREMTQGDDSPINVMGKTESAWEG